MPDQRRAFAAARPVLTGAVAGVGGHAAVERGPRHDIVRVRRVAAAVHYHALFGKAVFLRQLVVVAVQIIHAGGHHDALGVLPRALADAVARIHGRLAVERLLTEVGVPGLAAHASRFGERSAMLVGALEPTERRTIAGADTGDEERHVLLRRGRRRRGGGEEGGGEREGQT